MRSIFVRHVLLFVVAPLLAAPASAADAACTPRPAAVLLERFVPADCERCWQSAAPREARPRQIVLDWIVPASDDAPMASAALPEAAARAGGSPRHETLLRRASLQAKGAPLLRIADGPAWNGYIGLRLVITKRAPLPPGAVAYAALVERVPAGSEGSPVARQLVRAVTGPMGMEELATETKIEHLRAVSVPRTERPERLGSVAWVETAQGQVVAAAQSLPAECRER